MSIANDAWIRKMAKEHRMIEPFVEGLVTKGKISFGLSSYGYDVRVGRHFKIFHNLHSTLVDPKSFDSKSFVDHVADECIIPPNSFVLAETVERFRVPRNVLCVCLGKCVTGDTRVVDATTGDYLPIREFAGRSATVALDGWSLASREVTRFIPQGRKPVFLLTTRLGKRIRATANHPFRRFEGWTALEDLRPGDRIAAAREVPVFGTTPLPTWEAALLGFLLSERPRDATGRPSMRTEDDPVLRRAMTSAMLEGFRLDRHRASGWLAGVVVGETGPETGTAPAEACVPGSVFRAPREAVRTFLQALLSGNASIGRSEGAPRITYASTSRRLVEDVHHLLLRFGIVSRMLDQTTRSGATACRLEITEPSMLRRFGEVVGCWPESPMQFRFDAEVRPAFRERETVVSSNARIAVSGATFRRSGFVSRAVAPATWDGLDDADLDEIGATGPVWDTVVAVESAGEEEVFDLTVPGVENFLANDLVVHNSTYARCGIIVNVTPLEPEWEGIITIEISNTTPLPAKIYANEGIAQILFFKSDELCETSYADRKGKYQNQSGLTLPKISE